MTQKIMNKGKEITLECINLYFVYLKKIKFKFCFKFTEELKYLKLLLFEKPANPFILNDGVK